MNRIATNASVTAYLIVAPVVIIYFVIGALHVLAFKWTVTGADCLVADGLVYVYCDYPFAISATVVIFGWPLYWM
jgi:hypothetical protein